MAGVRDAPASQGAGADQLISTSYSSASTSAKESRSHETPSFVAPSDYLRPRTQESAQAANKPMGALEREQIQGLVRCPEPCDYTPSVTQAGLLEALANSLSLAIARNPRLPQSSSKLRCPAPQLQIDRPRHVAIGEKELEYPHANGSVCFFMQRRLDLTEDNRHRLGTALGLENLYLCWTPHRLGLY